MTFPLCLRLLSAWASRGSDGEALPTSGSRRLLALLATTAPFLTAPVWLQAVRAEVYALQLLLTMAMVAALVRAGLLHGRLETPWTLVGAFLVGLNLAVHPLLALLAALPMVLLALLRKGMLEPRLWAGAAAAALLGFSSYLMLPIRAQAHPGRGWGDPDSLSRFLDVLLARTFQHNFSPLTGGMLRANLEAVGQALVSATGPIVVWLAAGGLAALLFSRRSREAGLLAGLVAFDLWSILPQNKVYLENPDLHGYLMVSHIALWMLAAAALARGAEAARARFRPAGMIAGSFLFLLAVPAVVISRTDADRSEDDLARRFGLAALEALPAGAWLQVSGNDTMFILEHLQAVERRRPDVQVLSRTLLTHPWYRARLPHDEAWMAAAAGPVQDFLPRAGSRPLRVELRAMDLEAADRLCPAPEPGWGFFDVAPCPALERASSPPRATGLSALPGVLEGPHALLIGLNARAFLADYYQARGRPDWAAAERSDLQRFAPGLRLEALSPPR